jgi:hypothetical protein
MFTVNCVSKLILLVGTETVMIVDPAAIMGVGKNITVVKAKMAMAK